jgi:hypothetical protein
MSEGHSAKVDWIIANAISEQARGDPKRWPPISLPLWRWPGTAPLQQQRTPLSGLSHSTR